MICVWLDLTGLLMNSTSQSSASAQFEVSNFFESSIFYFLWVWVSKLRLLWFHTLALYTFWIPFFIFIFLRGLKMVNVCVPLDIIWIRKFSGRIQVHKHVVEMFHLCIDSKNFFCYVRFFFPCLEKLKAFWSKNPQYWWNAWLSSWNNLIQLNPEY